MSSPKLPTIGVVLNAGSAMVPALPPLLQRFERTLAPAPTAFVIAYGPDRVARPAAFGSHVHLLEEPCFQGKGVVMGFDLLTQRYGADKLLYLDADRAGLFLPLLFEFTLRIGDTAMKGRFAADSHHHTPYPQYVSETSITQAILYADPRAPAHPYPSLAARGDLEQEAQGAKPLYEALGLMGLSRTMWEAVGQSLAGGASLIGSLFTGSRLPFERAGIDAGLMLALRKAGFDIERMEGFPRRYEHAHPSGPEAEAKYAQSRIAHFDMEMAVILEFLTKTFQLEKVAPLQLFIDDVKQRIQSVGFHWPQWPVRRTDPDAPASSFVKP